MTLRCLALRDQCPPKKEGCREIRAEMESAPAVYVQSQYVKDIAGAIPFPLFLLSLDD